MDGTLTFYQHYHFFYQLSHIVVFGVCTNYYLCCLGNRRYTYSNVIAIGKSSEVQEKVLRFKLCRVLVMQLKVCEILVKVWATHLSLLTSLI